MFIKNLEWIYSYTTKNVKQKLIPRVNARPFFINNNNVVIILLLWLLSYDRCIKILLLLLCIYGIYDGPFGACTQVSWMRKRDLHILTAGVLTYTSDQRFQVIHPDNSDNWTLLIKFAQPRDAGIYECQVNTEPKMSLAFQLNVVGESRHI